MNTTNLEWEKVLTTFQQIWGYSNFRPPQGEIIYTILEKNDALVVMPTGGGKSICFQLPALLHNGLTLVISPLIALMENQVQELQQRNLSAALLHNEIPRPQRLKTLQALEKQQLRLLYLSPETLLSSTVWQLLIQPHIKINGLILDECHCLIEWGSTFRPAYRRLGTIRPALLKVKPPGTKIPIAAFTATADTRTQAILKSVLQLENSQLFLNSPYRSNLFLRVKICWTSRCRYHQLLQFIQSKKKQSGLVYVRSRRDSENLAQWLQSYQYQTAAYHAGLSSQQRRYIENQWLEGSLQFVVCTSAFGMGINKANVRWVSHFHPPQLLSEYLQEVGRGGRDGQATEALTLISEPTGLLDWSDRSLQQSFSHKLQKQSKKAQQILQHIPKQGNIQTLTNEFPDSEISLALLHCTQQLEWLDPFNYRLISTKAYSFTQLSQTQQQIQRQMKQYLITRQCRWQFLLNAFGFTKEAQGFHCGHCDNCSKN